MPSCPSIASTASYDFDAADADVVLLSSDVSPTNFRVHKCVLSLASPFFRDMFTLPQASTDDNPEKAAIPVIPVSESREVLEPLLRFVYPIPDPVLHSLDEFEPVLAAAAKYEFDAVIASLRGFLVSPPFLHTSPVKVYAIACRYGLTEEAKIASRFTLATDLLQLEDVTVESLKSMVAFDYHRLLVLHKRRAEAAIEFIRKMSEDDDGCGDLIKCMQCNGSVFTAQGPPKWWIEWEKSAVEELKARPTTDVVFGLDFLYAAASKTGCVRCMGSVLESWKVLRDLKEAIDSLPSTT